MAEPRDDDQWEEVINSVRGSCAWCKAALYVCHFCEAIVFDETTEPVAFGLGQQSSYNKPPGSASRQPTILIEHRLVVERTNPGRGLNTKCAALACVVAHEMAHHAMFHRWRVNEGFSEVLGIPLREKRGALQALGARRYAKLTGIQLDVVDTHWAPSAELVRSRISGEPFPDNLAGTADRGDQIETTTGVRIATEWCAAVIGCMVAKRYSAGPSRARLARDQIFASYPSLRNSEIQKIFDLACDTENLEAEAEKRAVSDLEGAHRNPDIQSCSRRLKAAALNWSSASAALRRL